MSQPRDVNLRQCDSTTVRQDLYPAVTYKWQLQIRHQNIIYKQSIKFFYRDSRVDDRNGFKF